MNRNKTDEINIFSVYWYLNIHVSVVILLDILRFSFVQVCSILCHYDPYLTIPTVFRVLQAMRSRVD